MIVGFKGTGSEEVSGVSVNAQDKKCQVTQSKQATSAFKNEKEK